MKWWQSGTAKAVFLNLILPPLGFSLLMLLPDLLAWRLQSGTLVFIGMIWAAWLGVFLLGYAYISISDSLKKKKQPR